jgi:hypothetical protein
MLAACSHRDLRDSQTGLLFDDEWERVKAILSVPQQDEIVVRDVAAAPQIAVGDAPAVAAELICERGRRAMCHRHTHHFQGAVENAMIVRRCAQGDVHAERGLTRGAPR